MRYEGVVYRPPSEASSLIIQLTIGCARNTCRFCYMYKNKRFSIRPIHDVMEDLIMAKESYHYPVKRIFLADGDALFVATKDLLQILNKCKQLFPEIQRVSAYGAPKDILSKSVLELQELKEAGLSMIYMGVESGNDQVLKNMGKGVNAYEMIQAGIRLKEAGIASSVTLISGLGGRELLKEHAIDSAKVINAINPDYLGFLTLMAEEEAPLYQDIVTGRFPLLTPEEIVSEMRLFLEHVDSENTIFRSNHASNYFNLSGVLNKDRECMLDILRNCENTQSYKPEKWRLL